MAQNGDCEVEVKACLSFLTLIAEALEEHDLSSNLLSIHNVELGNSFKSLELDTDSSRGSRESLDSLASSVVDDQSSDKVTIDKESEGEGEEGGQLFTSGEFLQQISAST